MASNPLIVVCGLAAEARIAAAPDHDGVIVIVGGGDKQRLGAELEAAAKGARGIMSFGVAGGLAPGLKPGDVRVADLVVAPDREIFTPHPEWAATIRSKLSLGSDLARFACVDTPLADVAGKAALYRATGADLVDMESHIAARAAARHGVPFAALRAVTDPAHRALPHAATVGMRADGAINLAAILGSLAKNPGQLPGLIRTGLDARAAFAALFRCRQLLGGGFALVDL